jgi:hypothetical protein
MGTAKFDHRIAMGIWINDIRNEPLDTKNWPDVTIDDKTLYDYEHILDFIKEARYDAFDIFGLLVGHDWPQDIKSVLGDGRKEIVKKMIDLAHDKEIHIIFGLGVYSWGFDKIIQHDPSVRGSNPCAMCGSKQSSKMWQERVIDLIVEHFDIDGFHLESSDQGRCRCPQCEKENDVQYHSRINAQTAQYIRSKCPDKFVLVNDCGYMPWGDFVSKYDFRYIYNLSNYIDAFIDNGNHGHFIREEDRKEFISGLKCAFGTAGGFWVYPPQRWNRLRWFLPYPERTGNYLKSLYRDGGRACEYYMGPTINPGTEVNILFGGLLQSDIEKSIRDVLTDTIERLYKPKTKATVKDLSDLFLRAEAAFFDNWTPNTEPYKLPEEFSADVETLMCWSQTTPERTVPGELFLEPLVGVQPGEPVYLMDNMDKEGRKKYKKELEEIYKDLNEFGNEFKDDGRVKRIIVCIRNVINDIEYIEEKEA